LVRFGKQGRKTKDQECEVIHVSGGKNWRAPQAWPNREGAVHGRGIPTAHVRRAGYV